MKKHNREIQMDNRVLTSKTTKALTVLALGLVAGNAGAQPAYGTNLDTYCQTNFNGVKPYTAYATYESHCDLCHDADNRSVYQSPEWVWARNGGETVPTTSPSMPSLWDNFCQVQGIIASPANGGTYSLGGKINLSARGFSPRGKTVAPLTYSFTFSDGRPNLVVKPSLDNWVTYPKDNAITVANVPLLAPGPLKITLKTTDGSTDPVSETSITLTVSDASSVAKPDPNYTVDAGNTLNVSVAKGVLANDLGVPPLTAVLGSTHVANGSLSLNPSGSFSYTPYPRFAGVDTFTYKVTNGVQTSAEALVTITVKSVLPIANADSYSIVATVASNDNDDHGEHKGERNREYNNSRGSHAILKVSAATGLLANDIGAGPLTVVIPQSSSPSHGTLSNLKPDGSFTYTPRANFIGTDSFSYRAHNSSGNSASTTVTIDVGACTDNDKDGFSPEGGRCGPVDCNDRASSINPGLNEICSNRIDDDCNGLADNNDPACPLYTGASRDCIGAKLANQVKIDSAEWKNGKLIVTGSKATVAAMVTIANLSVVDGFSTTALGSTTVKRDGTWQFEKVIPSSANASCRVQASINGASGARVVNGTTANCTSGGVNGNGAPPANCN